MRYMATYTDVRPRMRPGDIIAFGGTSHFSNWIKWATKSEVSHIAIIIQTKLWFDEGSPDWMLNQIIESADEGVQICRLSDKINSYDGEAWWLPLSPIRRASLDLAKLHNFVFQQEHKEYDTTQAILSGTLFNKEDFRKFYCSELAAAALEAGGVISHLNASRVQPIDMCRFDIYDQDYCQLKGEPKEIKGFNTLVPVGWGE